MNAMHQAFLSGARVVALYSQSHLDSKYWVREATEALKSDPRQRRVIARPRFPPATSPSTATPNRAATARVLAPPATRRSRRSLERGRAKMLASAPASILNHKQHPSGISPDSFEP
jgi:hypothetical protein